MGRRSQPGYVWADFPKVVEQVFPNAVMVIDRFHVMKAVNQELNKIRKQVGLLDRRSKYLLLKNHKDLTDEHTTKLEQLLQRSRRLQ